MSENKKLVAQVTARYEKLKSNRQTWDTYWGELAKYIAPREANPNTNFENKNLREKYVHGSPEYYANVLRATLSSSLTSPHSNWFSLALEGEEGKNSNAVREYLQTVTNKIHSVLQNSNFAEQVDIAYQDLIVFGTSPIYVEEDDKKIVRFDARPIWEVYVDDNANREIDTVYMVNRMTLRQIVERFGLDELPDKIKKKFEKTPDDKMQVLHACYPRNLKNPKKDQKNKAYASVWMLLEEKHILKESGFDTFPWAVTRWDIRSGEVYGRSQGMIALRNIKYVNKVEAGVVKAMQKEIDPPMFAVGDTLRRKIQNTPGAVNYVRRMADIPQVVKSGGRPELGQYEIERKMQEIKEAFFFDIIMTQDGTQKTATEIMQRTDERTMIFANSQRRVQGQMHEPLIQRVLDILSRNGHMPEMPESVAEIIAGKNLKIRYESPLARLQEKTQQANSTRAYINEAVQLYQMTGNPSALDTVNLDEAMSVLADFHNPPAKVIRQKSEVAQIRAQQQEAAQKQAMNDELEQGAKTTRNLAEAENQTQDTSGPVSEMLGELKQAS